MAPPDKYMHLRVAHDHVVKVIKARFPNLTVEEVNKIAWDIVYGLDLAAPED